MQALLVLCLALTWILVLTGLVQIAIELVNTQKPLVINQQPGTWSETILFIMALPTVALVFTWLITRSVRALSGVLRQG